MMRVLVTGSSGFLGSELVDYLNKIDDYSIIEVDSNLYNDNRSMSKCVDFRDFSFDEAGKIDAIVHLAGVSTNYDPPEKYYQDMAMLINYKETIKLAAKAKQAGVRKFIFASSASVYGRSEKEIVDEDSAPQPLTAYARSKLLAEKELLAMRSAAFCPVILRMVTLFGLSRRMRFDVLVNNLISSFILHSKVILNSDGSAIRPQVHLKDVCKVYEKVLEGASSDLSGEIINVGKDDYNISMLEIAKIIAEYKNCDLVIGEENNHDFRSYKVDYGKLRGIFGDILFDHDIAYAVDEIISYLGNRINIQKILSDPYFYNLKAIKHLIDNKIASENLRYLQLMKR